MPPSTASDLSVACDIDSIAQRLDTHGCCIVRGALPASVCDAIVAELETAAASSPDPGPVSRMGPDCVIKSPGVQALCEHEVVLAACQRILHRHCKAVTLKLCAPFFAPPGKQLQLLHHEDGLWPFPHPGMSWCIDCMWALDDFTEENGATLVVPNSQHIARTNFVQLEDDAAQQFLGAQRPVIPAVMPKGSVCLFTGNTLHAGGHNRSNETRKGMLVSYQLGWLRPEHRFYAHKELYEQVGSLTPGLQSLLGFGGGTLGSVPGNGNFRDTSEVRGCARVCLALSRSHPLSFPHAKKSETCSCRIVQRQLQRTWVSGAHFRAGGLANRPKLARWCGV